MAPRPWLLPTLALMLAQGAPDASWPRSPVPRSEAKPSEAAAFASGQLAPDAERARDLAQREWSRAIGALGYVYGAPLLELAIAEYSQAAGVARDLAGPRGVFAHAMGGRLPTHETSWRPAPDPDVLASSAWLDLKPQPYLLWIPPLEGHWYSVRFTDAFGGSAGVLSPRTVGSVGGWYLVATRAWRGELPHGVQGEVRVPTPLVWLIVEVAATKRDEAAFHKRYQSQFKLLPLEIYRRSPNAAQFASEAPQTGVPTIRATAEMRGSLDAFRVINQRLRRLDVAPGEEALLALFDRAGFGPRVELDAAKLAAPQLRGLREAAREGRRSLEALRVERATGLGWQPAAAPGAAGADYLKRAVLGVAGPLPDDVFALTCHRDRDGRSLDGRNDYRIRFATDALPPAKAFWSIAAYAPDTERLLDTATGRYSVGSLGAELAADGALEIWISSDAPEDPARRARWLPVRNEPFFLVARLRDPEPAALDGSWSMPPVAPVD